MAGPGYLQWLLPLIALTVGALALPLLWWALLRDRSRGRRRCPGCWYDMAGVPGLQCPECGRVAAAEREFHRTRRRWRAAWMAVFLLASAAGAAGWHVHRAGGWSRVVPTWALMPLLPGAENTRPSAIQKWATAQIYQRLGAGSVSPQVVVSLLRSNGTLRWRTSWPADQPLQIVAEYNDASLGASVEVKGVSRGRKFWRPLRGSTESGSLITVAEASSGTPADTILLGVGSRVCVPVRAGIRMASSLDEVVKPRAEEALTRAVERAVTVTVRGREEQASVLVNRATLAGFEKVGVCVRAELWRDGQLIEPGRPDITATTATTVRTIFHFLYPLPKQDDPDIGRWELRLVGDAHEALLDFDHDEYWQGTLVIPLARAGRE